MSDLLASFGFDGIMIWANRVDALQLRYEHMDLKEVAALENVGLVYRTDLEAGPEYARNDTGVYIMVDPLLDDDHQRLNFFKSLGLIQLGKEMRMAIDQPKTE